MSLLHKNRYWRLLLFAGSILAFTQCKKPEAPDRGPDWYKKEAVYNFDLETGGVVRKDYTHLVNRLGEPEVIQIYEDLQDTSGWNYHQLFRLLTDEWYRSANGLYVSYKPSCGMGLLSPTPRTYLFAPAHRVTGQELPPLPV